MLRHKPETPFGPQSPYLAFLDDTCPLVEPLLGHCSIRETDLQGHLPQLRRHSEPHPAKRIQKSGLIGNFQIYEMVVKYVFKISMWLSLYVTTLMQVCGLFVGLPVCGLVFSLELSSGFPEVSDAGVNTTRSSVG